MAELRDQIPGWEGSIGPGPGQYGDPHVYARDVHSGAGNCVCGMPLGAAKHVQAAPGVDIPSSLRVTQPIRHAVIGPELAKELEEYRGRWVAVTGQRVVVAGADASGVAAAAENLGHQPGEYLLFRVPKALAAFLGIGQ